jgi:hypothetical protein
MNEAPNEAVYERFKFIEEKLYWLQFIRFFRGSFIVQMLHIPALDRPIKEYHRFQRPLRNMILEYDTY